MAEDSSVCVSSGGSHPPYSSQSEGGEVDTDFGGSALAREVLAGGDLPTSGWPSVAAASSQGSVVTGSGGDISPPPREAGSLGLARERLNLSTGGLPHSVIDTIQSARASSTRSLYEHRWRAFENWCSNSSTVPFQCSVAVVLSFLQDLIEKGKAFSTVKVYLAAISACHVGFDGKTVGQHPVVCQFMKGARRKLPTSRPLAPSWDLPAVLEALSCSPFEPLGQVELKVLSLKTALLLALASAKRVGEIHALSVHQSCMKFSSGNTKVSLQPNPAFVPKVLGSCSPIELDAFYPPPFSSEEHRRLHLLCPVRALRVYSDRTEGLRKGNQLFVSWAKPHVGKPVSKQRLSHWIVEAITLAYTSKGLQPPAGLRAHSTRGLATSWALFKGVPIQEVCAAACWASPHTFARFYRLDVTAPTLAHSVLSTVSV